MEPVSGQIQTQPYLEPVLNHLSHCIEKYFMGAISIENIIKFLKELDFRYFYRSTKYFGLVPISNIKPYEIATQNIVASRNNLR